MPTKPMRPCRVPACPGLSRDGSGYCPAHVDAAQRRDNQRRNARRSTTVRDRVAQRDGGACVICGSTDRVQRHHVKPLSEGGIDDESNIATLCKRHHDEQHARRR